MNPKMVYRGTFTSIMNGKSTKNTILFHDTLWFERLVNNTPMPTTNNFNNILYNT